MLNKFKLFLENLSPTQIIVISFVFLILFGALLLSMPFSSNDGESVGFINALFTATSAVCVTGLSVVSTFEHWTLFGKWVILFLIQAGGLGFMTIVTSIFLFVGKKITLKERVLIKESFNLEHFQGIVAFVKKIILGTFIIEGIGAILFSVIFIPKYGFIDGLFKGIFHSVSAFCNAGFDIIGNDSLASFSGNYLINITVMLLIIIGGLGFSVWLDLYKAIKSLKHSSLKSMFKNLTLHTKLVLVISSILILFGWIFFFVMEFNNKETIGNMRFDQKLLASLFQSVTLRTAGFYTINQAGMTYSSKFFSIILMGIGGSPGSTAGGIKTVTSGIIIFSIISVIKGRDSICAYRKSISLYTLQKALAVTFAIIGIIFALTLILCVSELNSTFNYEFIDLLFESTSAVGTVGISTGITPYLSTIGKLCLCIGMFLGRLGPITVAFAIASKRGANPNLVHYPEEKILVG